MEFEEGGTVIGPEDLDKIFCQKGCEYYIPKDFAARYGELLEKLNERLDKSDEV